MQTDEINRFVLLAHEMTVLAFLENKNSYITFILLSFKLVKKIV